MIQQVHVPDPEGPADGTYFLRQSQQDDRSVAYQVGVKRGSKWN